MGKILKKGLSAFLVVVMLLTSFPLIDFNGFDWGLKASAATSNAAKFIEQVSQKSYVPSGYTGIYTAADLNNIRNNTSGKYILMNNIDMMSWGKWEPFYVSGITLDGNGFSICNLYSETYGLFIESYGTTTIKNLGLENITIKSTKSNVGGFVGATEYSDGGTLKIQNCFVAGYIKGGYCTGGFVGSAYWNDHMQISNCYNLAEIEGDSDVGGIVGEISSWQFETNIVENSLNRGTIKGSSRVGGIVGYISGYGDRVENYIRQCCNYGFITATEDNVGGICGEQTNTYSIVYIQDCYNAGNVMGPTGVGGISGKSDSRILRSYNIGYVSGSSNYGALVGLGSSDDGNCWVDDSYYSATTKSDYGTGLSQSMLKTASSFNNFDFDSIWHIDSGVNYGYPYLKSLKSLQWAFNIEIFNEVKNESYSENDSKFRVTIKAIDKNGNFTNVSGADIFIYLGNDIIKKFISGSDGGCYIDIAKLTNYGEYDASNMYICAEYQTDDYIIYSESYGENDTDNKILLSDFIASDSHILILDKYCKKYNISVAYQKGYKEQAVQLMDDFRGAFWKMTEGKCVIGGIKYNEYKSEKSFKKSDDVWIRQKGTVEATTNGYALNKGHIYLSFKTGEKGNDSQGTMRGEMVAHEAGHYFFGFRDEYCYGKGYEYDLNGNGAIDKKAYIIFYTESSNIPKNAKEFSINMTSGLDLDKFTLNLDEYTEDNAIYGDDESIIEEYKRGDLNHDGIVNGKYYYLPFAANNDEKISEKYHNAREEIDDLTVNDGKALYLTYPWINEKACGYWTTEDNGSLNYMGAFLMQSSFGIMASNYDTTELSTYSTYSYLDDINGVNYRKVSKMHPGYYTRQYFENEKSCLDMLNDILNGYISDINYSLVAHSASLNSSYYDTNLYLPDSEETFAIVDNKENIESNGDIYLSATETTEKIVDVSTKIVNDKIKINVNSENIQTYLFVESMENANSIEYIPLEFAEGVDSFELDYGLQNEYLLTFVQKDKNDQYVKNTYSISSFYSELSNDTFYSELADISTNISSPNGAANDLLIIKNDNIYKDGDFTSIDGAFEIINTNNDSEIDGEIIKSVLLNTGLNYETIGVFKYENGTYRRISQGYSECEKQLAYVNFSYEGDGIYIVMAEPASNEEIASVTNLSIKKSTETFGLYTINFEDENNNAMDLAGYNIYYSKNPISDLKGDDIYCVTISPYSKSYNINLKDNYGKWYFAVETLARSGAKSEISKSVSVLFNPLDSNNDGIPDYWIDTYNLSDEANISEFDNDKDNLSNIQEYQLGTNPINPDTDGDNVFDNVELQHSLNPLEKFSDGVNNDYIVVYGTPDLEVKNVTFNETDLLFSVENLTEGKAMRTYISLEVDGEIKELWSVNADSESSFDFTVPLDEISGCESLVIKVDANKITNDADYSNNTFTYTPSTSIAFEKESFEIVKGSSFVPTLVVEPASASEILSWSIEGSSKLSIDSSNGIVTSKGIGEATVTVKTLSGKTATCNIYSIAFEGAEYGEFDSVLINNDTEVAITGYIGDSTDISIPETLSGLPVTQINANAFSNSVVKSVTLSKNIKAVDTKAFNNANKLENIFVSDINEYFSSDNGVLLSKDQTIVHVYPRAKTSEEYVIPETVTQIGNYAFYCADIKNVSLPNNIRIIGEYAFSESSLTSVTIPENVETIKRNAFSDCYNMRTVYYNAKNASYSSNSTMLTIRYCFDDGVSEIIIGENVQSIPSYIFCNTNIDTIFIPSSVVSIGNYAFYKCSGLSSVKTDNLASWCNISFSNSYANPLYYAGNLYLNNELVKELVMPEAVTSISARSFYNCTSLENVELHANVKTIGTYAFYKCTNLSTLTILNPDCSIYDTEYTVYTETKIAGYCNSTAKTYAETYSREFSALHNYEETKVDATCVVDGYAQKTCLYCGDTKTEVLTAPGHSIVIDIAVDPTCTKPGLTEGQHCLYCNDATIEQIELPVIKHSFTKYEETEAPSCELVGKEVAECDYGCGTTDEKAIPATSHKDTLIQVEAKAPTCNEIGWEEYEYCTACTYTTYQEINALKHIPLAVVKENDVAPKCDIVGSYELVVYCDLCDAELSREVQTVPALEHIDIDVDYKCDNGCGYEYEKPVDPTPDEPEEPNPPEVPDEPEIPDDSIDDTCDHMCHKSGFMGFMWKIVQFFWKLFKMNPVCECGAAHY